MRFPPEPPRGPTALLSMLGFVAITLPIMLTLAVVVFGLFGWMFS